jgi:hypothetical protein
LPPWRGSEGRKPSKAAWSVEGFRKEWIAAGFDPAAFWDETPRSFVNAMQGAALREERAHNLAMTQAWNTAMIALNGYAGKLKNKTVADYLIGEKPQQSKAAQALAFFHRLKAAGLPVEIKRVVH